MIVSIEVPVIEGAFLIPCIDSVLKQTSRQWRLSLLWDAGDELSRRILEKLAATGHPQVQVLFREERGGIAPARRFLTENSQGDWILTLDHDDLLHPDAVRQFLARAETAPWASIIRAMRGFVDESGKVHPMEDWFPFQARDYYRGMPRDVYNHSQPALLRRAAYDKTSGWEGFPEYHGAGEDCDIFLKLEEHGEVDLLAETLYYYRIHGKRTSNSLGAPVAEDMWRRLADKTITRRQLPLKRVSETQPYAYRDVRTRVTGAQAVDVVIPFFEADESEIEYPWRRPTETTGSHVVLRAGAAYTEAIVPEWQPLHRVEIAVTAPARLSARIVATLRTSSGEILSRAEHRLDDEQPWFENVSFGFTHAPAQSAPLFLDIELAADAAPDAALLLHTIKDSAGEHGLFRFYRHDPGAGRRSLERCVRSLHASGIGDDAIHIASLPASAAANRNHGMWQATREFVCFVDDDVEVPGADVFEILLDAVHSMQADLVGPRLLDAEDRIYCAAPWFDEDRFPKPRGLGEADTGQYNFREYVTWLPSTCLLMRRAVALAAPPWNEDYTGSQLEDVDFCLQARARGFNCAYVGDTAVRHYNLQRNYRFSKNLPYFRARWKNYPRLFENLEKTVNGEGD